MNNKLLYKLFLSVAFTLLPVSSMAVSLGESEVLSTLGQPIRIEIEVLQWQQSDLSNLTATLADESNFNAFGLDYLPVLNDVQLELLEPNLNNGELKILLSSSDRMQEPFMEVLLLLSWNGGSLLREYVFLFDLPVEQSQASIRSGAQNGANTNASRASTIETIEVGARESNVQPRVVRTLREQDSSSTLSALTTDSGLTDARGSYRVLPGDTLFDVALQFQPSQQEGNFYQMLLSLFELNPSAFENGNIAILQAEQDIIIPNTNDLQQIDPLSAEAIYNELWEAGETNSELSSQVFVNEEEPEIAEESEVIDDEAGEELTKEELTEEVVLPLVNNLAPAETEPVEVIPFVANNVPVSGELDEGVFENVIDNISNGDRSGLSSVEGDVASLTEAVIVENVVPVGSSLTAEGIQSEDSPRAEIFSSISSSTIVTGTARGVVVNSRREHIELLQTRVLSVSDQLEELHEFTANIQEANKRRNDAQLKQQKLVDTISYGLAVLASLLTLGLIIFVMRNARR